MSHDTLEAVTDATQDGGVSAVAPDGRDTSIYDEKNVFTARELPWMQLGTVIDKDVDAAEAARLGGLDFEIELYPAGWTKNGGKNYKRVPKRFAIVRKDTDEFFNFASDEYGVVQYAEAFDFLNAINPRFVAAGALRGGRVGFMVIEHPNVSDLSGLTLRGQTDPHQMYVVVRTSQDLSYAVEISLMNLRGICMNSLTIKGFNRHAPQRWSLRHSKSVAQRMHNAQTILTNGQAYLDEFERIAQKLVDIDVDVELARQTLTYVLPDRPQRDKQVEEILDVYQTSERNGFQGTGWGLVQGVSEYFEWERPTSRRQTEATKFTSVLEGQVHKTVDKTVQVLFQLAA